MRKTSAILQTQNSTASSEFTRGTLTAYNTDGQRAIDESVQGAQKLEDLIGKDLSKKLLESKATESRAAGIGVRLRQLSGLDLNVGGEGMISFYDSIVPKAVNTLLKKLGGGRMETVELSGKQAPTFALAGRTVADPRKTNYTQQTGFTITDALRNKAAGGMPLFSRSSLYTPGAPEISTSLLNGVIGRVTAKWRVSSAGDGQAVVVVPRFEDLPDAILAAATEQKYDNTKSDERVTGVTYKGKIYLVQQNITSEALAGARDVSGPCAANCAKNP